MATYYAYASGSTAWTWNSTNTTNWYSGSGGTGTNGTAPTASDTVIFNSSSGTGTVTWSSGVCQTLQCVSGYTGTISSSTTHSLSGSLTFVSTMTYTGSHTITFSSTTSGNTVATGTQQMPSVIFNGAGGVWTLQDTWTSGSANSITLTNGDLECNGQTISTANLAVTSNTNTKVLTISSSSITLNGTGTIFGGSGDAGSVTYNTNSSTNLYVTDTSATTKTIYTNSANSNQLGNLYVTGGTSLGLLAINGTGGFYTLTNTAGNPVNITLSINNTLPVTTFNITGSPTTQSTIASGTAGTKATVALTNNSTWTYVTVQDIHVTGATITDTTGGYSGGDNTGISFSNPYLLQTQTAESSSSSSTITATFGSSVTAKSLLVAEVTIASGTVTGVADAESNTHWTLASSVINGTATTYLYFCWNATGGTTNKLTVSLSTSVAVSVIYREYGGIVYASNPLDQVGTATGTSGNISVSTNNSTVFPNELVIGAGSDFTSTDVMSVGTGYTNFILQASVTSAQSALEELVISSTGTQTATIVNPVTSTWSGIIATFQVLKASTNHFLSLMGVGS